MALKVLKEKQWQKPNRLPLAEDIENFRAYVSDLANSTYIELRQGKWTPMNYRTLTECVLALTVMFNQAFGESLTLVEKIISKKFKRVVTGGKGSKPVPILFSSFTQKFIRKLLEIRHRVDIVPKTNPYLFANPKSERSWMSGYHVIRKLVTKCGAKNPSLMTSTKFRKQIATTLQLVDYGQK
ncbi:hypothetical protein HHI36_004901 [Cryptolaemus montrouzieri]|uniref:PiggyBac transposable element-derived protein domain-containing protein n=1 Tax=Cryptolaemus montrouzieri TaxID=559131 RepID=A0ABD2NSV4_9CUCU